MDLDGRLIHIQLSGTSFHHCCNSSCVAGPSHSMEWVQLGPPGTPGWGWEMPHSPQGNIRKDGTICDCTGCTGNPGWACFRFALCLPPKSPRFLTLHRRGMTQASSFPLHLDPLYLPLMGLHSEMRSGRRNHCVRRHCHITKHLGLLQARKRSFCLLLSVSSLQIQKVHLKRVWESNTHRLTAWMEGKPWQLQVKS